MIGVEFVQPGVGAALCDDIIVRAFHHGLLLLPCGLSTVRFCAARHHHRGRGRGDGDA
jgi:4-aminobutyrate aminotransferase-like enzyme